MQKEGPMTEELAKKVAELMENVQRYMPLVHPESNPFAFSSAKYYPALKKLAAK